MAGVYYFTNVNLNTTCDGTNPYDLGIDPGYPSVSYGPGISFDPGFVQIMSFDRNVGSEIVGSENIAVSINVTSIDPGSTYKFRVQQIDPSGCAVLNSSSYSSTFTTTGVKTANLTLAWTGSTGILRVSIEAEYISGLGTQITIACSSNSNVAFGTILPPYSTELTIARDNWWLIPSGNTFMTNNGLTNPNFRLSNKDYGLYQNIIDPLLFADGTAIINRTPSGATYYFRTNNTPLVPDRVVVTGRVLAGSGAGNVNCDLYLNGAILPNAMVISDHVTEENVQRTIFLNDYQKRAILNGRVSDHYDFAALKFNATTDSGVLKNTRIYSLQIKYANEDNRSYLNYTTVPGASVVSIFPSVAEPINCHWQTDLGATFASGNTGLIQQYASGVDADARYIKCVHEPYLATFNILPSAAAASAISYSLPSGGLNLHFHTGSYFESNTTVNRANLYLRMSLPVSGFYASSGNMRDYYEVHGYNPTVASGGKLLWGAGQIVQQSGFATYTTELCWLDPSLSSIPANSGDLSSILYKNSNTFNNLQLKVLGIPSGAHLSAAELRLEYTNSNSMNLYVAGATASSTGNQNLVIPYASSPYGFSQDLYIHGAASGYSNSVNLYLNNRDSSGSLNLYTYGSERPTNNLSLYTLGSPAAVNVLNLYTRGIPPSANMNLYIKGGLWSTEDLPLYTHGRVFPSTSRQQSLFTYATSSPGIRKTQDLFVGSYSDPLNMLPLFVQGYDDPQTDTLPLFLQGQSSNNSYNQQNLYVHNVFNSGSKTINLFAKNTGVTDSGTLPLYINRANEGIPSSIPLFMKVIDGNPASGQMDMIIKSAYALPMSFDTIADSYIDSTNTSTNYGTNQYLKVTKG